MCCTSHAPILPYVDNSNITCSMLGGNLNSVRVTLLRLAGLARSLQNGGKHTSIVHHGRILRIFRKSSFGGFYASLLIRDIPCKELKQKIQSCQQGFDNHHDGRNDQKPDRIRSKYEMKQHNRQQREYEQRQQQAKPRWKAFNNSASILRNLNLVFFDMLFLPPIVHRQEKQRQWKHD